MRKYLLFAKLYHRSFIYIFQSVIFEFIILSFGMILKANDGALKLI